MRAVCRLAVRGAVNPTGRARADLAASRSACRLGLEVRRRARLRRAAWVPPVSVLKKGGSGDRATARVYLENLVDRIVVGADDIIIEARAGAAIAMMAVPERTQALATGGGVLADVYDWRARRDSNP